MRAIISVELSSTGLVKMGGGDWNDGMDKVGIEGSGKSVWCSMFLYFVLKKFGAICKEADRSKLNKLCITLRGSVNKCFNNDRFIRAITDDGTVLGSEAGKECKIDLLVQSWAVLSGITDNEKSQKVLKTAYDRLVDEKNGIIKLLDPPFAELDVGYISKYPKGVRENGGQYSHAAAWFVKALYVAGEYERAEKLLAMMLPCNHAMTADAVEHYRLEPYVMPADIYAGELSGQGGWSWYTGSAGHMWQNIFEHHYGINVKHGRVMFTPRMVGKAEIKVLLFGSSFMLCIDRHNYNSPCNVSVAGISYSSKWFSLTSLNGKTVQIS